MVYITDLVLFGDELLRLMRCHRVYHVVRTIYKGESIASRNIDGVVRLINNRIPDATAVTVVTRCFHEVGRIDVAFHLLAMSICQYERWLQYIYTLR